MPCCATSAQNARLSPPRASVSASAAIRGLRGTEGGATCAPGGTTRVRRSEKALPAAPVTRSAPRGRHDKMKLLHPVAAPRQIAPPPVRTDQIQRLFDAAGLELPADIAALRHRKRDQPRAAGQRRRKRPVRPEPVAKGR
ncbi:hypothetical protein ACTTAL_05260 [Rhodobacter capsulatus]